MKINKDFFKKDKNVKQNRKSKIKQSNTVFKKTRKNINAILLPKEQILWKQKAKASRYAIENLQEETRNRVVIDINIGDNGRGYKHTYKWTFLQSYKTSIVLLIVGLVILFTSIIAGIILSSRFLLFGITLIPFSILYLTVNSTIIKYKKSLNNILYIITDKRILKLEGSRKYIILKEIMIKDISEIGFIKYETSKNIGDIQIINKIGQEDRLYAIKDAESIGKKINLLVSLFH